LQVTHKQINTTELQINSINEETLNYGIGDQVLIVSSVDPQYNYPAVVVKVSSSHILLMITANLLFLDLSSCILDKLDEIMCCSINGRAI
jgi:hypothetical protein